MKTPSPADPKWLYQSFPPVTSIPVTLTRTSQQNEATVGSLRIGARLKPTEGEVVKTNDVSPSHERLYGELILFNGTAVL